MSRKMRLDELPEEPVEVKVENCQKLNAAVCSVLGVIILVLSVLVLRNERLQIHNYLEPMPVITEKEFPTVLLGCTIATTAGSVVQIIGSLMVLFEDISTGVWRWIKFVSFMICTVSLKLLETEKYNEIFPASSYYVWLIVNCVFCGIFLLWNLCRNRKSAGPRSQPY